MKRLKPLFALPVLGALVFALACTEEANPETNEIVFEETEIPIDVDLNPIVENVTRSYWSPTDSLVASKMINGKVKVYLSPQIQKRVDDNTVIEEEEIPLSRVVSVEIIKRD